MKGAIMFSGGGSGKLFAAIGATYPAGSTLTCTNGTKTLTAKTTSGQWVFAIPEAGTWTVTATQGTNTKSQSVSITAEGQFESVTLSYGLYLYKSGDECTDITGGWNVRYGREGTALTPNMLIKPTAGYGELISTTNKIDVSKYSKLSFEFTYTQGTHNPKGLEVGLASSVANPEAQKYVASVNCGTSTVTNKTIKTLDISAVEGLYHIAARSYYSGDGVIYEIWLEE